MNPSQDDLPASDGPRERLPDPNQPGAVTPEDYSPDAGGYRTSRTYDDDFGPRGVAPRDYDGDFNGPDDFYGWSSETEAGAVATATASEAGTGRRARRIAWELIQTLALAALIFLLVRAVAQNFRVEGPSMEPGLHNGQYLLVNKAVYFKLNLGTLSKYIPFIDANGDDEKFLFHGPQRGDVIVFRYPKDPDRDFIKRVIGIPGDTVRIDDEGIVYVNGEAIEEDYVAGSSPRALEEQVVPPESYFVLGDNRSNSSDSRNWGFVPEENIIGKAMLSYWPLSELGGVGNHSLDLGFVSLPLP